IESWFRNLVISSGKSCTAGRVGNGSIAPYLSIISSRLKSSPVRPSSHVSESSCVRNGRLRSMLRAISLTPMRDTAAESALGKVVAVCAPPGRVRLMWIKGRPTGGEGTSASSNDCWVGRGAGSTRKVDPSSNTNSRFSNGVRRSVLRRPPARAATSWSSRVFPTPFGP
ncbi:MAG: hypothetical protein JWM17_3171, partial [Actinobacteria bacterium]|nr:hypothetical protein [Actinomycetota bacterium]